MAPNSPATEQTCSINKISTLSDMQHESHDLIDKHVLQTITSDVAASDKASTAQSLEMILSAHASKKAHSINESATFLGMPREIRDLIYHFVFQNVYVYHAVIPARYSEEMSKWDAAKIAVKKVFGKLDTTDLRIRALLDQNFMISHQIRDEILPVVYKQYVFSQDDDDRGLCKTSAWLQHLQLEQLRLVQNVHVRVSLNVIGALLPLRWMEVEEEISRQRGEPLNVTLDFPDSHNIYYWILAYSKCLARRQAGATWAQIREQTHNIFAEIDDQLYVNTDEESDVGADSDYDMWNDYDSYSDEAALDDEDDEWFLNPE